MTKPYYLMPDDENYISKTDLKKEARQLQEFASQLCQLSKAQRALLPEDDELKAAFVLADKIANKPDALRRHLQFMAKLLRDLDTEALQEAYQKIVSPHQDNDQKMRLLERMREHLLNNGDDAINSALEQHPMLERQKLRQLIRQASKEQAAGKPDKGYKALFQYLKSNTDIQS